MLAAAEAVGGDKEGRDREEVSPTNADREKKNLSTETDGRHKLLNAYNTLFMSHIWYFIVSPAK